MPCIAPASFRAVKSLFNIHHYYTKSIKYFFFIINLYSDLGGYQFGTIDGVPSYKAGADAVWIPFKGGWRSDVLTPVTPFSDTENGWFLSYYDISSLYDRYKEITIENIVIQLQSYAIHVCFIWEMGYAYNPELGRVIVKLNPVHFYPPSRYEGRPSIRIAIVT